jgi:diaminopimelate decarboxylase
MVIKEGNIEAWMKNSFQEIRSDAKKVAARFGTPVYMIHEIRLKRNYDRFRSAFQKHWENVRVSYSVKTNYLPAVVRKMHAIGTKIEVVSQFELYLALKTGIPGKDIIFNGPCKVQEAIDYAVENGVGIINADSTAELERIDRSGKRHGKKVPAGLRICTPETWQKFGVPIEHAARAIQEFSARENIAVRSIHAHIGANVNPAIYVTVLEKILDLMRTLRTQGIALESVDMGGGYPVPGLGRWGNPFKNLMINILAVNFQKLRMGKIAKLISRYHSYEAEFKPPPEIETYGEMIGRTLRQKTEEHGLPPLQLVLEPGRYIVSSAVALLAKVLDIKEYNKKWVMVDGGTNLAGSTETAAHHVGNVSSESEERENIILAGPLCHGGDILSNSARIAPVSLGDIIIIQDVGAYNISQSRQFITPRANAVMVREDGEMEEIRRRESFEDVLILDSPFFDKPAGA